MTGVQTCALPISPVFIFVLKILIFSTVPETPPASIKSPAVNGRKIINITPEAKFCKELCRARPTARPAAPSKAIIEVVLDRKSVV